MDYSHKDFTRRKLTGAPDLNGLTIRGSCFSQETPDSIVFPPDMTGVTFINCNLDNCIIPEGNIVIDCQTRRFKVQNDLNDWEIDESNIPTNLVNSFHFWKKNIPMPNPADIPDAPVKERIRHEDAVRK